jgi:hypothetical protein
MLEEDGEIIELTEKVSTGPARQAAKQAAPALDLAPFDLTLEDEEIIELTDRLPAAKPAAQSRPSGRADAPEGSEKLLDTLELDEAAHSLGDRLGDDLAPSRDEHLGFTTTLDDTLEFDEGILDLTALDENAPAAGRAEAPAATGDAASEVEADLFDEDFDATLLDQAMDDEQIIGLSSEPLAETAEAQQAPTPEVSPDSELPTEDLTETIELDDLIASDLSELEGIEEPLTEDLLQGLDLDEELDGEGDRAEPSPSADDFIDTLGMEIEPAAAAAAAAAPLAAGLAAAPAAPPAIGAGQLEQALVKAIREVYAERIEQMLLEAIEKAVSEEIGRLKGLLLEEGAEARRG